MTVDYILAALPLQEMLYAGIAIVILLGSFSFARLLSMGGSSHHRRGVRHR